MQKNSMRHIDALHILGITSKANADEIKYAYRQACKKYHPDLNAQGLEMMKLVNIAYESLQDVINGASFDSSVKHEKTGAESYGDKINEALGAIINLGLTIEICGAWVYVSGDTKPHREVLKNAGFRWAPKKMLWIFRPPEYKSFSRGKWSMDKIRDVHGSSYVRQRSYARIEQN